MTDPITPARAKALAPELAARGKAEGTPIKHSKALEEVARRHGFRNFNTLVGSRPPETGEARPERPEKRRPGKRPLVLYIDRIPSGAGATTIAHWIAVGLGSGYGGRPLRVLAWDFDEQGELGRRLLPDGWRTASDPEGWETITPPVHPASSDPDWPNDRDFSCSTDLFTGQAIVPYETHSQNVHVIPSHMRGVRMAERAGISADRYAEALQAAINEAAGGWDAVIIEASVSNSPLKRALMTTADRFFLVHELSYPEALDLAARWMKPTPERPLSADALVVNQFHSRRAVSAHLLEELRERVEASQIVGEPIPSQKKIRTPPLTGNPPKELDASLGGVLDCVRRWVG